jgi:hypothetical protein
MFVKRSLRWPCRGAPGLTTRSVREGGEVTAVCNGTEQCRRKDGGERCQGYPGDHQDTSFVGLLVPTPFCLTSGLVQVF